MGVPYRNHDPLMPPLVGPFGVPEWVDGRRWRVRLSPDGVALVESTLAEWPHPENLLYAMWPSVALAARQARFDPSEVGQLCRLAAVRAAAKYDPTRGAAFTSYWSLWCRAVVGRAVTEWCPARRAGLRVMSGDTTRLGDSDAGPFVVVESPADPSLDPVRRCQGSRLRTAVADVLRRRVSSPRKRQMFAMRYGMAGGSAKTLKEVAASFGVSKQLVHSVVAEVMAKVRDDLEVVYLDNCR
jgi:hypothetical protein